MAGSHQPNGSEKEQQGSMLVTTATATAAAGDHWEVEYARFFNRPLSSSADAAAGHHPSLVPLVRKLKGLWIPSFTSFAYLKLLTDDSDDDSRSIVLTVNLVDKLVEEHYITKLHFTWPQASCMSGYPPRGIKTVFMSYKDHQGQIQKFAVRFHTVDEALRFINSLKDLFGQERIDGSMSGISKSKTSSQSQIFPSPQPLNRLTEDWEPISSSADNSQPVYRPTQDWSPVASPADAYIQPIYPSKNHDTSQNSNPLKSTLDQDVQEKLSAFPPSFSSLLMNCFPAAEQATQPTVPEEVGLKNEIMKYLEDSSFQDMLIKVEKVISEFGDDLL